MSKSPLEKPLKTGRPRTTHGGYSYLVSGHISERNQHVLRYLVHCREGLIVDLDPGGEANLSTSQVVLVDRAVSILGVIRLIEEYAKVNGIMEGPHLTPSLGQHYLSFNNSLRLILNQLGVSKGAGERILTPIELVKRKEEERGYSSSLREKTG